jgi:hypothetical protein
VSGVRTGLTVARVVDHQHPVSVWGRGRITQQQRESTGVDCLGIPGRLGQEELQALDSTGLSLHNGLRTGESSQRLVTVPRQQESL